MEAKVHKRSGAFGPTILFTIRIWRPLAETNVRWRQTLVNIDTNLRRDLLLHIFMQVMSSVTRKNRQMSVKVAQKLFH